MHWQLGDSGPVIALWYGSSSSDTCGDSSINNYSFWPGVHSEPLIFETSELILGYWICDRMQLCWAAAFGRLVHQVINYKSDLQCALCNGLLQICSNNETVRRKVEEANWGKPG